MGTNVSKEASGLLELFAEMPGQAFCDRLFRCLDSGDRGVSMDSDAIKNLNHHPLLNI